MRYWLTFMLLGWLAAASVAAQETPDYTLRRIRVPILMYHYVSELPADADAYRVDLTIRPSTFQAHLDYLRAEGYTTVSLYDLDRALVNGAPLPAKPIILTFDDGYREHYDFVFPRLRDYGMTGTFFIITDPVESGNPRYVTWGQLQEMAAAGMSIEPHTKTHLDLRNRDYDFLVWEVLGSLQTLQGQLNVPAAMFAYPAGRYDDFTLQILDTMPIQRAVTTQHGVPHTTDNGLELTRLRVNGDLGVSGLVYLLNSAG